MKKIKTYVDNFKIGSDLYQLIALISHRGETIFSGHYLTLELLGEQMIIYDDDNISLQPVR